MILIATDWYTENDVMFNRKQAFSIIKLLLFNITVSKCFSTIFHFSNSEFESDRPKTYAGKIKVEGRNSSTFFQFYFLKYMLMTPSFIVNIFFLLRLKKYDDFSKACKFY